MDTDRALNKLGALGAYQMINYFIVSTTVMFGACFRMLESVFFALEPEHHCTLPVGLEINGSVPLKEKDGEVGFDSCNVYSNFSQESNITEACPSGWTYDNGTYTIVHKWNLVCDRAWLVEMSQTVLVGGVVVGALLMSMLSDRYGRKKIHLLSLLLSAILGCANSAVTNYIGFTAMRFLMGILQQGILVPGFVLACEMFPTEKRTMPAVLIEVFWGLGMSVLTIIAYFVRDWRYFLIATSIPGLLAIPLYWVIGESLPWLVARGRMKEARQLLRRAARWNRVTLPDDLISEKMFFKIPSDDDYIVNDDSLQGMPVDIKRMQTVQPPKEVVVYTIRDIFRSRKLTIITLILIYLWCVVTLVYYGLSLSTGSLSGGVYLNFFYSALAEIAAYIVAAFAMQYIGRRWPLFGFFALAGVTMAISTVVPKNTKTGQDVVLAMTMIGKFGITGCFGSVFLYSPELYPTTLRTAGIGLTSLGGRIGNLGAPFSAYLARTYPFIIGAVFGFMSILAAIGTLLLPETLGRPLATTIEEVESWSQSPRKKYIEDEIVYAQELKAALPDIKE